MGLTPKQEKFCQNIVSGMSGKDAYISAYDTNGNPNNAYVESSKLLLREDIQKKITTLRIPQERAAQIEGFNARKEQINFIKSRIQECIKKEDENSLIRWNEQLNKIYALYKDTEQETKPESTVNNLDMATLKRLSGVS